MGFVGKFILMLESILSNVKLEGLCFLQTKKSSVKCNSIKVMPWGDIRSCYVMLNFDFVYDKFRYVVHLGKWPQFEPNSGNSFRGIILG